MSNITIFVIPLNRLVADKELPLSDLLNAVLRSNFLHRLCLWLDLLLLLHGKNLVETLLLVLIAGREK